MGLRAGQGQSDAVRRQRFLDALDTTLTATVHRRLDLTQDEDHDPAAVVLLGAAERQYRAQTVLVNLLLKGGSIRTNLGQLIDIPSIPVLSIRGMEHADGMDAIWRHHARRIAFAAYAALAPGVFGVLETALPDAAKAVELAGKDRADAKKRGGSGGRKAKMAGTLEPVVQHLPIGNPTDEDSPCISPETLADDRLNPQEKIEAQENETESMEDAQRAMRVAFDRWGESGQLMLESLAAGATDKDAAKAAGISAPALTKRLKTLKKKLLRS
jgi:hypothetical protein